MFLDRSFALSAKNQNFLIVAKMCGPHVEAWYFSTMIHKKLSIMGGRKRMMITSTIMDIFILQQHRCKAILKNSLFCK